MITKQELRFEDDGTCRLRNTVDLSGAIAQAKEYDEMGMGNGKNGYMLGVIPEEMYQFDPWLKEAMARKREGDMAGYTTYMLKFFKIHRALAVNHKKCMWGGYAVPIISGKESMPKRPDAMERLLDSV